MSLKDSDIFNACENQPKNVLDINGLFDFANFHSQFDENGDIIVSGNITTVWAVQPTDTIEVIIDNFRSTHNIYSYLDTWRHLWLDCVMIEVHGCPLNIQ